MRGGMCWHGVRVRAWVGVAFRCQPQPQSYQLARNNGPNALHGGIVGFDKVLWSYKVYAAAEYAGVAFSYTSHDGEEGYPGTLKARPSVECVVLSSLVCRVWFVSGARVTRGCLPELECVVLSSLGCDRSTCDPSLSAQVGVCCAVMIGTPVA